MAATNKCSWRPSQKVSSSPAVLDVEAELHHVAVGHDIVLAFDPDLALGLGLVHGPGLDEVGEVNNLGLDEAALEVGVDDAGGHGGGVALVAPADAIFLDAKLEADLAELDEDEAREMLEMNGQDESGLDQLARVGFHTLGLQTYLTAGPKETRAWTIHQGDTAPQAAGVIHSDFQRGFIKAEVVHFEDLIEAGSMHEAKAKGKVRIEGKDYVMHDGDVVEFRFNV